MSEIKFACPYCSQHIACDESYAGLDIACPVCQKEMRIPQPAGAPLEGRSVLPRSTKAALYPTPRDWEFWTETSWKRHAAETPGGGMAWLSGGLIAALVFLPIIFAFLLAPWLGQSRVNINAVIGVFAFCSAIAAWLSLRLVPWNAIVRLLETVRK